ncbi:MAG: alanine racemase [Chloroflexota bacterium]|nr:alanine racemase [Chloroflexota bacterium]
MTVRSPHRAWIEVDLGAIAHNLALTRRFAGAEKQVIGIVKANAYGHGDLPVARTLVEHGAERLGVATLGEGLRLRGAGIDVPITLLYGLGEPEAERAVAADLEPVVYSAAGVALIERAAAGLGRRASVQLKVDTGFGRQGAEPTDAVGLALAIARSRHLRLGGTFSHLAVPGEDEAHTDVQLLRMAQVLDAIRSAGVDPGLVHISSTGGILAGVGGFADAIRPGLILYGMAPSWADRELDLHPALTLRALPLRLFDLAGGEAIGYGLRFRAQRPTRIATLGIGYGDGWPRSHANNGFAIVRGVRVPVIGAVSMDGLTVDIGEIDGVTYDDEFVLIGEQGGARITADEVAVQRRTINYEVTTALRDRLPRIHLPGT